MRSRMASISAYRVRSATTGKARPPVPSIPFATEATASASRPCTATAAPSAANSVAIAAPIPRELPVTSAISPFSSPMLIPVLKSLRFRQTICMNEMG